MKRLFGLLCLGLVLSSMTALGSLPVVAADLTFAWDANPGSPWEKVRLYEKIGANYSLKGEVVGTLTTITITGILPGAHSYIARSFAATVESADSNTATTTILPGAPGNFRIVVVTVSPDGAITGVKLMTYDEFESLHSS
jgi:hypothetical protein